MLTRLVSVRSRLAFSVFSPSTLQRIPPNPQSHTLRRHHATTRAEQANSPTTHASPTSNSSAAAIDSDFVDPFVTSLVRNILAGDRLALSTGITLVESTNLHHRTQADAMMRLLAQNKLSDGIVKEQRRLDMNRLLQEMTPEQRQQAEITKPRAIRIGISGPPVRKELAIGEGYH